MVRRRIRVDRKEQIGLVLIGDGGALFERTGRPRGEGCLGGGDGLVQLGFVGPRDGLGDRAGRGIDDVEGHRPVAAVEGALGHPALQRGQLADGTVQFGVVEHPPEGGVAVLGEEGLQVVEPVGPEHTGAGGGHARDQLAVLELDRVEARRLLFFRVVKIDRDADNDERHEAPNDVLTFHAP